MTTTVTPSWTDNVAVLAVQSLARNAVARSVTLDLRARYGAYLHLRVGKQGTTALTNGVDVIVRRAPNNAGVVHPGDVFHGLADAPASQSTVINVDVAVGATTLNVAATASWAAGDVGLVQDAGGGVTRAEFFRVARVTDATHLLIDAPAQFAHTAAQADTVRNKAAAFPPVWCPSGSVYEVVFDYGDDAAGEAVVIEAIAQRYDADSIT